MDLKKMSNMTRIDRFRLRFIREKIWFTLNFFAIMPAYTWLLFVYIYPKIHATGNTTLEAWYEFWIYVAVIAHMIYGVYVIIRINELREKILNIENEMDSKTR
jgi:hypothetical protein